MVLGAGAIWLAFCIQRVFSSASIFQWGSASNRVFPAALIIMGLAVTVVAYCFGFRWGAECGAGKRAGTSLLHTGHREGVVPDRDRSA